MHELHDQKGDAVDCRYSIFEDGKIILMFNVVEGGLTAEEVFEMISKYNDLNEAYGQEMIANAKMKAELATP